MICRHSLRMALRIVVGLLLVAGGAAGYLWLHADDMVTGAVRDRLAELTPGWEVELARVQVRGQQAIVHGVRIRPDEGENEATTPPLVTPPLIEVPEVVVTFDREALANWQTVQVEHVRLVRPTLTLIREADGRLNVQSLPPLPPSQSDDSPSVEIDRARVLLVDALAPGQPLGRIQDIDLDCQPSAHREYRIAGSGRLQSYGQVAVHAFASVPHRAFSLEIAGQSLQVDDRLVQTLATWYPPLSVRLADLRPPRLPGQPAVPEQPEMRVASVSGGPYANAPVAPLDRPPRDPTALGLTGLADVSFRMTQSPDRPADWSGGLRLRQGTLRSPLFPLPLHNLAVDVGVSPRGLEIRELQAANGSAQLAVSGTIVPAAGGYRHRIDLAADDLSVSGPLRRYLTPGLAKLHAILQPTGSVAVRARFDNTGAGPPIALESLSVRDGTAMPTLFPYPVTDIRGDVRPAGDGSGDLAVSLAGRAGGREVQCSGLVHRPGPGAGFTLRIEASDIPLDRALRQAFRTERLKDVAATLDALAVRGRGDATVVLTRAVHSPAQPSPVRVGADVRVREAEVTYDRFPYPLRRISGRIRCETTSPIWYFEDFAGEGRDATGQGAAQVAAAGTFDRREKPGRLALRFAVDGAPVDGDLRHATTVAMPSLRAAWDELNPRKGTLGADGIDVRWSPGQPVAVDLPDIRARGCDVELASFPFRWSDVDVDATVRGRRVLLRSVTAQHDQTRLEIVGRRPDGSPDDSLAYVDASPVGYDVHLQNVQVLGVRADAELLRAMPGPLRDTVATLRPQGPLHLRFNLHMAGEPNQPVRFDYAGEVLLTGNTVSAGVTIENAKGTLRINDLKSDGRTVRLSDGRLELETAEILGLKLTDIAGPITLDGNRLVVGSERSVRRPPRGERPPAVAPQSRLTAKFYGGRAAVDAVALLGGEQNELQYAARVAIDQARLEQWARENAPRERLSGEVRGEVRLSGFGDDLRQIDAQDGYVQISEARLYTLPPIAKIFSALSMRPVEDDTAFRYAYGGFEIKNGRANFGRVELIGDAVNLGGRGFVSILPEEDYALRFDLISQVPNRTPIIGRLIEGLSTGWVTVLLQGSLANPVVTTSTGPPVAGTLQLFRDFRTRVESGLIAPPR